MILALPYFFENARDLELIGVALGIVFWFQMLRHCFLHEPGPVSRLLWMIFMIVMPGISSLFYFFFRVVRVRADP